MKETKVQLHKDLNLAFAELLKIARVLNLSICLKDLKKTRSFMSRIIDKTKLKSV